MRILYIITGNDPVGGAMIHVTHLAHRFGGPEGRHTTRVIIGANSAQSRALLDSHDVDYRLVEHLVRPISPFHDLAAVSELRLQIREFAPDLVSTHSSKAGIVGRLAARRERVPALFTAHGWAFTVGVSSLRRRLYRQIERFFRRYSSRIICVSEFDRQLAIDNGFDPRLLVTVHNGVPDTVTPPPAGVRRRIEQLAPGAVRAVMVARFSPQKDHATLIEAASGVPDLHLVLVGEGELEEATRALAVRLGIADRVHFAGYSDRVAWILSQMDLFCLVSNYEGFPRTTIEAMGQGLPVVVSDVGGAAEAVEDGVSGYVIPQGDTVLLRERLAALAADPDLRRRMGSAGRDLYRQRYTLDALTERTERVYEEVMATAAPDGSRRAREGRS